MGDTLVSFIRTCSVAGCMGKLDSHGFCGKHAQRFRRHGNALTEPKTQDEIFWSHVLKTDNCWLWTGLVASSNRYGKFGIEDVLVHRFSYTRLVGPVPDGLELDHLCNNRLCVNPDHLEPVTHKENMRRADVLYGIRSAKTECPQGHPYDEQNTYHSPQKRRQCRACARIRQQHKREKLLLIGSI